MLRSQNVEIVLLNNHTLLNKRLLSEYKDVLSLQVGQTEAAVSAQLNSRFYVDFVLRRNQYIKSDDALGDRLYLCVFEFEKLLFQSPPLSMSDKLIAVLQEFPQGVDVRTFCKEYDALFRSNFLNQSGLNQSVHTLHRQEPRDGDGSHGLPAPRRLSVDDVLFDDGTIAQFQAFFDEHAEIAVCKYVPATQDLMLFANIHQKVSLTVSTWIQDILVHNRHCWLNAVFNAPDSGRLLVEFSIRSPSTLILNGKLSHLEAVINYIQWLDRVEQCTAAMHGSQQSVAHTDDAWNMFVSHAQSAPMPMVLFDTQNMYHHRGGRFKLSKELLQYGIQHSYFLDVDTMQLSRDIFVHHIYDAPSPISLEKFLQLQDGVEWRIPLVVQHILRPRHGATSAETLIGAPVAAPTVATASKTRSAPSNLSKPRDLQAKVIGSSSPSSPSPSSPSLPAAIQRNLSMLSASPHFIAPAVAKKLLELLRAVELEQVSGVAHANCKPMLLNVGGDQRSVAISEYDILELWKSYNRAPLSVSHAHLMKDLIDVYYPYFEVHLVATRPRPTSASSQFTRYLSIRDDQNVLGDGADDIPATDKNVIHNKQSFQAAVAEFIAADPAAHSDGIHLSQLVAKLSRSNRYQFAPTFFSKNWDAKHSLSVLLQHADGVSTIQSSPRYDPIVTAIESQHSVEDFVTREVHGHDRRDGNGVPLTAILSLIRAASPNFFATQFKSLSFVPRHRNKSARKITHTTYYDDVIEFFSAIDSIDVSSTQLQQTQVQKYVTTLDDIVLCAAPDICELHESITQIVGVQCTHGLDTVTSVDAVTAQLWRKYPALKPDKYGFEDDVAALIASTPQLSVYRPYPLSPSFVMPATYVTLCDAISQSLATQFEPRQTVLEVQLRSAVLAMLAPNDSLTNPAPPQLYDDYERYLTDIPRYFSHLLQCEWNEQQKLWTFRRHDAYQTQLVFRVRSLFEEFDRSQSLFNAQNATAARLYDGKKQIQVPSHSFQQKWDLKFGAGSFAQHRVESVLLRHPFIFVHKTPPKHDQETTYVWNTAQPRADDVRNALLLQLSESYGHGTASANQCHLNDFQRGYAALYGHPCVQHDMYRYLANLNLDINAESLVMQLSPSYFYRIPLPISNLAQISYLGIHKFAQHTMNKLVSKKDVDPYAANLQDAQIVSLLHRNLHGLYLKLFPLPSSSSSSSSAISHEELEPMLLAWINRLCAKYLGNDVSGVAMDARELSIYPQMLSVSNLNLHHDNLNLMKKIMPCCLQDTDMTAQQHHLHWTDKMLELLPAYDTQQSVTFEQIQTSLPFDTEQQFLSEILFEPKCVSCINIDRDHGSGAFRYSLLAPSHDAALAISHKVSAELVLQNIISMNTQGMHLAEIKKYFPVHNLQHTLLNSFIDWLQHRFGAYIAVDEHAFVTWTDTRQLNEFMRQSHLSELSPPLCVSREHTLNELLFVQNASMLLLKKTQSMAMPTYLNSLSRYVPHLRVQLPVSSSAAPSSVAYDTTQNYDWLYNAFVVSHRSCSASNLLRSTHKLVPLRHLMLQILRDYHANTQHTPIASTSSTAATTAKLTPQSLAHHMPLCVFASQLYDQLVSHNACLSLYTPLFEHLPFYLQSFGFAMSPPSVRPAPEFEMIDIVGCDIHAAAAVAPHNVQTLLQRLCVASPVKLSSDPELHLQASDIEHVLNYCHHDVAVDYAPNSAQQQQQPPVFTLRAPLLYPLDIHKSTAISAKLQQRDCKSQIDDIAEFVASLTHSVQYMRLSPFIDAFAKHAQYPITISPLISVLSTQSNRHPAPIFVPLTNGDCFIACDEDASFGARIESLFIDNDVDALDAPQLESLWHRKFGEHNAYPSQSVFKLMNKFSTKFVVSMASAAGSGSEYVVSLLRPHAKFSCRVKCILESLQTSSETEPVSVDRVISQWNTQYPHQSWSDADTINLYLLPFIHVRHASEYETTPMLSFDTHFTDIFAHQPWNESMLQRLDLMVRHILYNAGEHRLPLSQFQSEFLSFSGFTFPAIVANSLIESLRRLSSITINTSSHVHEPVIGLKKNSDSAHGNGNDHPGDDGTHIMQAVDHILHHKQMIAMNLSNFNRYYAELYGHKLFQTVTSTADQKSKFFQSIVNRFNTWKIEQNSDGYTIDWLVSIPNDQSNENMRSQLYSLRTAIAAEITRSEQKRIYESELPAIIPHCAQFRARYQENPDAAFLLDQYGNTKFYLMYNSPHIISIHHDNATQSTAPYFRLRTRKFIMNRSSKPAAASSNESTLSIPSSYQSLEELVAAHVSEASMRLCDFQTLLYDKLPVTTQWTYIFNRFPASLAPYIRTDYSKLDRHLHFERMPALHDKITHYIQSMTPPDSKLREDIMQQFHMLKTQKLELQRLASALNLKWTILLQKLINTYSLDFQIHVGWRNNVSTLSAADQTPLSLASPEQVIVLHPPAFRAQKSTPMVSTTATATSAVAVGAARCQSLEQALVTLRLEHENTPLPLHLIQQRLYELTGDEHKLILSSNLMEYVQSMGIGTVQLAPVTANASQYHLPTVEIRGWQNSLERDIMRIFASSSCSPDAEPPYLASIQLNRIMAHQPRSQRTASNSAVFSTLTDSLWKELFAAYSAEHDSYRFALRPSTPTPAACASAASMVAQRQQLDAVLNSAHERVLKLSHFQTEYFQRYQSFVYSHTLKPLALSEYLSAHTRYCVLPLCNGDHLVTFSNNTRNFLRYFVRNMFGEQNYDRGCTLEQIEKGIESQCHMVRLRQQRQREKYLFPFPINSAAVIDICSDLLFPMYITNNTPNGRTVVLYRKRKKNRNLASNVRDVLEEDQQENGVNFMSFQTLQQSLIGKNPPNSDIEQDPLEIFKQMALFPWLRFHLVASTNSTTPPQHTPPQMLTDSSSVSEALVPVTRAEVMSAKLRSPLEEKMNYDWNVEITLSVDDIQTMKNDVSCEIITALSVRDDQRPTSQTQTQPAESVVDEDGRTQIFAEHQKQSDLTLKPATFQTKFSALTGTFYNPAFQPVTHFLLQISYSQQYFPTTLLAIDIDYKLKQLFASRFFGVRLSELNEFIHENHYPSFGWCLARILDSDPDVSLIQVPYGPPDFFVLHAKFETMAENEILVRLQEIFKRQRMSKNPHNNNNNNMDGMTLMTESQIRSEWKLMFGKEMPFALIMDLYHAFSHHFNDFVTVHSFGNNKMFSMSDVQLMYHIGALQADASSSGGSATGAAQFSTSSQEIAKFVQKDQLTQQRRRMLLTDALHRISNDVRYKSAEELLFELYEAQLKAVLPQFSTATVSASSVETSTSLALTPPSSSSSGSDVVHVSFSQLFRNVLQPLKLEIGRSQSIDWLSFLLFRFDGYLTLLNQYVPDLQFALQNMAILQEKCDWVRAARINPCVKFNAYEREQILACLTQNEEEMRLSDLHETIGQYFWSSHGRFAHHHLARTYSTDIDIQTRSTPQLLSSSASNDFPMHSRVDPKWSSLAHAMQAYNVTLRSGAPHTRFCDIFEPFTAMLERLNIAHRGVTAMNEIQSHFYMLFGCYIPAVNLETALMRYGATVASARSSDGDVPFRQITWMHHQDKKTQNELIVDAIIDYIRSGLIARMRGGAHTLRDSQQYTHDWVAFDDILAYLHTLHLNITESAHLFEDIVHYLIDRRSMDFELKLDGCDPGADGIDPIANTNDGNATSAQSHQNPRKTNWKIKFRPFIGDTNGKLTKQELHNLVHSKYDGAIYLSQLQSALYDTHHKIIEVYPAAKWSLFNSVLNIVRNNDDDNNVNIQMTPCGADSIVYTDRMSMYRECVRYALTYYHGGLTTYQLRGIMHNLLKTRRESGQCATESLDVQKDYSNIFALLSNTCFSFAHICSDVHSGVSLIQPFRMQHMLAHKVRHTVQRLLRAQTASSLVQPHADGVLLDDVKHEMSKHGLWNHRTHEYVLSAPFLNVQRDVHSHVIRVSCLSDAEIDKQRAVILHHIVCENVLKCNTFTLQEMYATVAGTLLKLQSTQKDDSGQPLMIADADQHILKQHSLKDLLKQCNLRLHHDRDSRENLILPKTTVVRFKKPWLTKEKQLKLRGALRQLAKQYRIRFADFVEEFIVEVPTLIASSTFFIHGSGMAQILTAAEVDHIVESVHNACHDKMQRPGWNRELLDLTIHGEHFSMMMGLDCAHLLRLTFLRGTIRSFLRQFDANTIRLSSIQHSYMAQMQGSRWWSANIADELRKLNCVLYADGYGDFLIDISHLKLMYADKAARNDLSFKIM